MESHREPKWCCVSSLTKIVTFFAVPFWSIPTPLAVLSAGQHRPERDRYVPKHNARNNVEHPGGGGPMKPPGPPGIMVTNRGGLEAKAKEYYETLRVRVHSCGGCIGPSGPSEPSAVVRRVC